jgi:hypothetical protein
MREEYFDGSRGSVVEELRHRLLVALQPHSLCCGDIHT